MVERISDQLDQEGGSGNKPVVTLRAEPQPAVLAQLAVLLVVLQKRADVGDDAPRARSALTLGVNDQGGHSKTVSTPLTSARGARPAWPDLMPATTTTTHTTLLATAATASDAQGSPAPPRRRVIASRVFCSMRTWQSIVWAWERSTRARPFAAR